MSLVKRRTITKDAPLTKNEIKKFVSQIEIGEIVPTIAVVSKHWTSTSNYKENHKAVNVTVLRKYPNLVETDYGVMTWSDLILGYHSGIIPAMIEEKSNSNERKAA